MAENSSYHKQMELQGKMNYTPPEVKKIVKKPKVHGVEHCGGSETEERGFPKKEAREEKGRKCKTQGTEALKRSLVPQEIMHNAGIAQVQMPSVKLQKVDMSLLK